MNDTVAVVVTYNRKDLLRQNLNCLMNQQKKCDVLVIDNASTDGTSDLVELQNVSVIYHNTGSNLGGAGGFEIGVKLAVEKGYKYIWIMDDDTLPKEDALLELFKADEKLNGKWGWLSSVAYWTDGSVCKANKQKKSLIQFLDDKDYEKNVVSSQMASFVALLTKASVIEEIGLPIGEYFIWTDDYEFTGRVQKNYPCYTVPASRVIHAMKIHTKANLARDDISRISRYELLFRNDVHCYKQYGLKGWSYIILKDLYTVFEIIRRSKGHKKEKIEVLWKGFKKGINFNPEVKKVKEAKLES